MRRRGVIANTGSAAAVNRLPRRAGEKKSGHRTKAVDSESF
jgi:hypothetical protein